MRSAILANFFVAKSAEMGADLSALQLHNLLEPASGPIIANRLIRLYHEGLVRIIDPEVAQDLSSRA